MYTESVIRKQHTTEGVIKMERFELRYVMGHIEVYDENGRSAFLRIMCPRPWRNYGRSSAQPDPYRLIGEKSLPSKWKAGFCRAFSYLSLFQSAFMNTHSARLYLPFILPGSGAQLRTSHSRGPAHRRYPRSSYSRPSAYRAFRDHPLRSPADFQS